MNIYTIYKATNRITNKSYIGFDSHYPNRIKEHQKAITKERLSHYAFYRAIIKYGFHCFEWSILYQSKDKDHTLNEMESYFIEQYDLFNNGYNMTKGGDGTPNFVYTDEHKKKWSNVKLGNKNPFYNKKHTEESKQKIKLKNIETKSKMTHSNQWRKVVSPTGEVYNSIEQASKAHNMNGSTLRHKVRKSQDGWRYFDSVVK